MCVVERRGLVFVFHPGLFDCALWTLPPHLGPLPLSHCLAFPINTISALSPQPLLPPHPCFLALCPCAGTCTLPPALSPAPSTTLTIPIKPGVALSVPDGTELLAAAAAASAAHKQRTPASCAHRTTLSGVPRPPSASHISSSGAPTPARYSVAGGATPARCSTSTAGARYGTARLTPPRNSSTPGGACGGAGGAAAGQAPLQVNSAGVVVGQLGTASELMWAWIEDLVISMHDSEALRLDMMEAAAANAGAKSGGVDKGGAGRWEDMAGHVPLAVNPHTTDDTAPDVLQSVLQMQVCVRAHAHTCVF